MSLVAADGRLSNDMQSPVDQIRRLWSQTLCVLGAGLVVFVAVGLWTFGPIDRLALSDSWSPKIDHDEHSTDKPEDRELIAVFDKPLWTPSASTATEPVRQQPAVPVTPKPGLVLVGIVSPADSEAAEYEAILYDPGTDTTHIVREGENVGGHSIGTVTAESAQLKTQSSAYELVLDTGRKTGRG